VALCQKAAEELPHVADQQIERLHGGEVAAGVELRPVHDVALFCKPQPSQGGR
jgi:hypothetical protein